MFGRGVLAVRQGAKGVAQKLLGVGDSRAHLLAYRVRAQFVRHSRQRPRALRVRGERGEQVGPVVGKRACRIRSMGKEVANVVDQQFAAAHEVRRRKDDALFGERSRVGRHRTGARSADLGMMGAAGDVAQRQIVRVEDGGNDGHIGKMRAAERGMVCHDHVARSQIERFADALDAGAQRAQMDRDVRRTRSRAAP